MGNGNGSSRYRTEHKLEIKINDYVFPKLQAIPSKFGSGIATNKLGEKPKNLGTNFNCPVCERVMFDGGMCQIVTCSCGTSFRRNENNKVFHVQEESKNFSDIFEQFNSKNYGAAVELKSITFGVYERTIPDEM